MRRCLITILLTVLPLGALAQELTLEQCLDAASGGNVTLRGSSLDVQAAKAQQAEARWEFVPRVSVTAIGYDALDPMLKITLGDVLGSSDNAQVLKENISALAYENGIKPYYSTLSHGYGVTATLLQPLYAGGRIINGNRLADLGVEAAALKDHMASLGVRDSVESKYWRIVALQEKKRTLEEASSMLERLTNDLGSAVSSGLAVESDMARLKLKRMELENGLFRLEGSLSLLKMELMDYAGIQYDCLDIKNIHLSGTLDQLPSPEEVLAEGPSVESLDAARLLQLAVDAKKTEKKMAIGEFLPQVAVGATYGYNAMMLPKNGSFNGILFATVKVPLTDIGKASARARRYDYAAQKAEIDRDYYLSRLRLQEAKCRLDVETLWMEISMAEQRVALADDKLSKTRIRFSAGQATASEVLQASLEATSERESLLQTKTAYLGAVNAWRHR